MLSRSKISLGTGNAMSRAEGNLTAAQYEIMQVVWNQGDAGASVAEIWQAIARRRAIGRTTVLNLVDRLEKRGWLIRSEQQRPVRYVASQDRSDTNAALAEAFVKDFFGGSASGLVMSLVGSQQLTRDELQHLWVCFEQLLRDSRKNEGK